MNQEILIHVLNKKFVKNIIRVDYETTKFGSGVCDDVRLFMGFAETADGEQLPFKVVLKNQKKVSPPLDADSWTREYYFYASDFYKILDDNVGMPECYHSELSSEGYVLWLEYIEGVTGDDLTTDDMEYISERLGEFHGKIYTKPELAENLSCLSHTKHMEKKIWFWHKSREYDYLRSNAFDIPEYLKQMLIETDDNKKAMLKKIEQLPIVLYHGDFHDGNVFLKDGKVILFDWGHFAGWWHLGEDIANLISDNDKYELWNEYYRRFVAAYLRGFARYTDISEIEDFYIREMIILNFGYDIVQNYMSAKERAEKENQITALQKIYEMRGINVK